MAKTEGIKSILVVPLRAGDNIIGVMRIYSKEERQFNEKEIRFLDAVANLSAIALDNARLYQALQKNYDLVIASRYRLDDL